MAKVPLKGAEVEFPILDAGVFEDREDDVRQLISYAQRENRDHLPLGRDMAAIVSISHYVLKAQAPDLTRDEVRKAITVRTVSAYLAAIVEGFGFKAEGSSEGEGLSPPTST